MVSSAQKESGFSLKENQIQLEFPIKGEGASISMKKVKVVFPQTKKQLILILRKEKADFHLKEKQWALFKEKVHSNQRKTGYYSKRAISRFEGSSTCSKDNCLPLQGKVA